jgi:regulatory protein
LNKILQLRKKGRLIELQTTSQLLLLQEETVLHFRLLQGVELSTTFIEEIQAYDSFATGLEKAYHYLSFKPRSVAQMKEYLKKKEIGAVDRIVAELKQKGYLNDEVTAQLIADQVLASAKGTKVVRQKLIEAKIHPETIDRVISNLAIDDFDVRRRLMKYVKPTTKSKRAFQASLMQKMMAAGFSYDRIQQAVQDHHQAIIDCVDEPRGIAEFIRKNKALSKDQMLKKLLSQGYEYGLIQQGLKEADDED